MSLFILAIFRRYLLYTVTHFLACFISETGDGPHIYKKKCPSIILETQGPGDKNGRGLVYLFLVIQLGPYFLIEASVTRAATRNEISVSLAKQTRRLMSSQSAQLSVTTWHPSLPVKCACPKLLLVFFSLMECRFVSGFIKLFLPFFHFGQERKGKIKTHKFGNYFRVGSTKEILVDKWNEFFRS